MYGTRDQKPYHNTPADIPGDCLKFMTLAKATSGVPCLTNPADFKNSH